MERKIVTASLCWPQSHSETPREKDVPLGFVNGAATSTNLLSQFPFPLLPPSLPPSLHCPPQKVRGRPLGTSPLPSKGTGTATGYFPCPPTEDSGKATGYPPVLHRRCGGGKDIAGVLETYNRNKNKGAGANQ